MTLILKILSVIGVILAVLLLVLLWITIMPRHFWIEYSKPDGPMVKMNIGFFKVNLYPLPEFLNKKTKKKQNAAEKEQPTEKAEDKEKFNPFDDIEFSFSLVKEIISAAKGIMKRIFNAIKFKDVSFTIPVHSDDAFKTQKTYGLVTKPPLPPRRRG